MPFRVLWRRAATAIGIYGSALLGILASIVAARELSTLDFARFALVFATVALLQLFLDVTVEEVVVKYGNRYAASQDWGRFRRLLELGLRVKLAGGIAGAAAVVVVALIAPWIWKLGDLRTAMLVAALIPLVQAPEGMAGAVLLLRTRYDVRGALLLWSMLLRLVAIAVGASFGLVQTFVAIVIAQVVVTASASVVGLLAVRRYPHAEAVPLGTDRRAVRAFAIQSTIASALASMRGLAPTVLVGIVAKPLQVGYFRIAQAPQTAFASLSSPARLVLLAEQTRDVEHGRSDRAYRLLRRYIAVTLAVAVLVVPIVWIWTRTFVRVVYGARYIGATDATRLMLLAATVQLVFGWTKSFPVSIGRPGMRSAGQLLELLVLLPLVVVFGSLYGAAGAAGGVLAASCVLAAFWSVGLLRLRAGRRARRVGEAPA
jgi:O-antigen/teichoic acid export membrane protein